MKQIAWGSAYLIVGLAIVAVGLFEIRRSGISAGARSFPIGGALLFLLLVIGAIIALAGVMRLARGWSERS